MMMMVMVAVVVTSVLFPALVIFRPIFQAMGWSSVTVSPHFDKIHSNNIKEKTKTVDYCISSFQLVAMK